MLLATPVEGYLACCEALSTLDQRALLPKIKSPTLVIAGTHDKATPVEAGEVIRSQHSRRQHDHPRRRAYFQCRAAARLHGSGGRISDAALIPQRNGTSLRAKRSNPVMLRRELDCFVAIAPRNDERRIAMDDNKRRDDGMTQRRKVLGDAWVDKSVANRNAFNADFQDLITRYAWGEIWTRPHFDERTRRVLVIGTMVALGQWDEFRLHVRAALARRRLHARRHQGNPAAAGDLLRRAGGQPRRQGSRRDRSGTRVLKPYRRIGCARGVCAQALRARGGSTASR